MSQWNLFQWTGQVWHVKSASSTSVTALWRQFSFHSSALHPSTSLCTTRTVSASHQALGILSGAILFQEELSGLNLFSPVLCAREGEAQKGRAGTPWCWSCFPSKQLTGYAQQWEEGWCWTNRAPAATSAHSLNGTPRQVVQAGVLNRIHLGPENMNPNKSQQQDPHCIPTWLPKLRALTKMAEPKCLHTSQGQRVKVFLEGHWEPETRMVTHS